MSLPSALSAAVLERVVRPFYLVELDFPAPHGPIRVWSGVGWLTWNDAQWGGVSNFGGISDLEETCDLRAAGITLTLFGIPTEQLDPLNAALMSHYQGRAVRIWKGLFDEDWAIIADPVRVWTGKMDAPRIVLGDDKTAIGVSLAAENILADLSRSRVRRWTDQDQKRRFPGDKGFEYVATLQELEIFWGRENKRD